MDVIEERNRKKKSNGRKTESGNETLRQRGGKRETVREKKIDELKKKRKADIDIETTIWLDIETVRDKDREERETEKFIFNVSFKTDLCFTLSLPPIFCVRRCHDVKTSARQDEGEDLQTQTLWPIL